jgi:hypothetical protein
MSNSTQIQPNGELHQEDASHKIRHIQNIQNGGTQNDAEEQLAEHSGLSNPKAQVTTHLGGCNNQDQGNSKLQKGRHGLCSFVDWRISNTGSIWTRFFSKGVPTICETSIWMSWRAI